MKKIPICLLLLVCLPACLPAWASDGVAGRVLEALGVRKSSELPKSPRQVTLRMHASAKLNSDAEGRALPLVARIYTLRQSAAFEAAPYAAFLTDGADREAFGADLVGVREQILLPGQRYDAIEHVPREAAYVGVVALFHSPAPQRWRLAFTSLEAEKAGLTVGVQSCALSAGAGAQPLGAAAKMHGPAHCQ